MPEQRTYAVYFHPQAIDVMGEAIKPYLTESAEGKHVLCHEIDTSGTFCEMTLVKTNEKGKPVECEVMIPSGMIRLVIAITGDETDFGFG
ncbi:MAG: hypothetical protein A3E01_12730 [Gammaproteobacteria bacterium RIFCSPHIGHO2_12_FULL_63_22]|nr:MAG: hypothetical protein A3E01_12730 [Gammaproteobacteria bacterium RIFCSPHIGHO2_12_FULL_63_22]